MKFKKYIVNYIIPIILFAISRNDFIGKYMVYLSVGAIVIYLLVELIDIFLLLNGQKFCDIKNCYIENRIKSLKDNVTEIKKDTLDYIFKENLYYLVMTSILLFYEVYIYKDELHVIFQIITSIIVMNSAYKVLLIFIYNEVPEIYYSSKFTIKRVEKNIKIKEENLYIIHLAKLFITAIIIAIMLIKMI